MQLSGYGLLRIPLPRTPVNKGKSLTHYPTMNLPITDRYAPNPAAQQALIEVPTPCRAW
jgi:hypothetical protein